MTERISKPIRQLAAISLSVILGIGLWLFVWSPIVNTIRGQDAKIIEQREVLGRLSGAENLAGQATALEQKSKSIDIGKLTLKGDSDPLRTAELQTELTKIVTAHGLRLKSTRALPARDTEGVRLVGVQAQFQATLEQLQKILLTIEDSEAILVIEALRMVSAAGATDPKTEAPLDINIDVFGATGTVKG
jgi:type II secretory pathway component PulM